MANNNFLEDKEQVYKEYRKKYGKELENYETKEIKELNYMWLRDRHYFTKQLIDDFGYDKAKEKLEILIDRKAQEIAHRYRKWGEEKGITNPILIAFNGYFKEWPWIAPSWWLKFYPDDKNPTKVEWRLRCHIGSYWKEQSKEYWPFAVCFCDVDEKIFINIDSRLTFERPLLMYEDDSEYCKFVITLKE